LGEEGRSPVDQAEEVEGEELLAGWFEPAKPASDLCRAVDKTGEADGRCVAGRELLR